MTNDLINPGVTAKPVTPNDGADLPVVSYGGRELRPRALLIGASGALHITTLTGEEVTLVGVPVGILPVMVKRVFATGTVAENITAIY